MDELGKEGMLIEQVLHKLLSLVEESSATRAEKDKMKEEMFEKFYKNVQSYEGLTKLKSMSLEEIKAYYEKFKKTLDKER